MGNSGPLVIFDGLLGRLSNIGVFLTPSKPHQPGRLWSLGLHLIYCALILVFHWRADLPLRLGLLTGSGFLILSWALSRVRTSAPDQVRQVLVGFLAPMACLCWGAALSPFNLMMLFGCPVDWSRIFVLGLGPWTIAWAIGGAEFHSWVADIRPRLAICAALTAVLFLFPHAAIFGRMAFVGIGLSWGWATYLAILTGVLLVILSSRAFAFSGDASDPSGLRRTSILALKGTAAICLFLLAFPPWRVEEQMWRNAPPSIQPLDKPFSIDTPFPIDNRGRHPSPNKEPVIRGDVVIGAMHGFPEPSYGPPRTHYEPWYMCFYQGPVDWVGPDISGPERLRRIPRNDDERIYVRYVQPNRRLSLELRRWLIPPAVTALLAAGLVVMLRGRNGATQ